MKDLIKINNLICYLLFVFLFLPSMEARAQVKAMSAKELTQESTAVLYGKCSKVRSEWNDKKSAIFTYVTIVPEAYIKGNLGSEAVITVPGGRVDDILYEVSEMPVFAEGEEVVAFVWTNPSGKNLITGGYQGRMKIEKDKKTGKKMVEAVGLDEDFDPQSQGTVHGMKGEKVDLDEFVSKVKGYAGN